MRPEDAKAEVIEHAASRARERLEAPEAEAVERFVTLYYEHAGPEDVVDVDPADLYGAALAHYRFGQLREAGTAVARVYTPRVADHGWQSTHTAVEVVTDDMPFIVDSVHMELSRHGLGIHRLVHPIVDGVSYVHVEVDRQSDPEVDDEVERDLLRVLGDARAAVEDWQPMVTAMRRIADGLRTDPPPVDADELAEIDAFLRWLADGSFTFLGYREYDLVTRDGDDAIVAVPGTGLGILRQHEGAGASEAFTKLPPEIRRLARERNPLVVTKANTLATVHRPSYLDYIGVKRFDAAGEVTGERRFLGLFTQGFYNSSPTGIPLLRRKVQLLIDRAGLPPGGHDEKDLAAILETYPRDELLQVDDGELYDTALGILHLQERKRVRLFPRRDRFGRFFSCLVFLPRERYNTDTRVELQRILVEAFHGERIEHQARVSASVLARLHFVVHVDPADQPAVDLARLEERLAAAVRNWSDDLHDSLVDEHGEERGVARYRRYREAFRAGYRADNLPRVAVDDIERLEALGDDDIGMHLYRPLEESRGAARFKLYRSGRPVLVSDVLPLLENLGVRVADQRPHTIRPEGSDPTWIYDFGVQCEEFGDLDLTAPLFQEAFARVWRGDMENDGFNRLVLLARLPWRDVTVLRAYTKYLRQAGTRFSPDYVEAAVAAHPDIATLLVTLFHVRFDPGAGDDRDARAAELVAQIEAALDDVASLDEDRILRSLLAIVRATLRTTFFQAAMSGAGPKAHLSLKLDPRSLPDLPLPRPMYEIFVYAPSVEGVHLRGGPVARGGIRSSDRRQDFRTEILGLMKAQMVKNAVIVPVGAKGGFVVKQPPAERSRLAAEVERCYRTFISGLLDLTDNRRGAEVVPPPDVVRYDGDDPYLVVAADKGTAAFSDIANEVAAGYGFWLGDAFASGGSAGYDHKKMGITARGAWESVKRHFRDLGIDVATTAVTAIGIGDMSGDVFGNGMLLSRHLKLVAAFNHLHVFVDPDPDPEASFHERQRLFELPRSTWADYDAALLSRGGGVYPRSAKSIAVTPEVRGVLGLDPGVEALPPNDLIRAILRAPVDLLWNGGIGTYVKASSETHADVGDKANDGVRVDATDLRCRVVGEGGNLGFTQQARIQLARAGGRINTDAIDNSAGVDCSDHEVNIKILVDAVVADGDLTRKQRDALLAGMTDEVAALVLADNEGQTQALANAVAQAASLVDVHARYTRWLEQEGSLDRAVEFLPTDEEYVERKAHGEGLTAPEFAVLLAYTKNTLEQRLLESDMPDDPFLTRELVRYFPSTLRERFASEIEHHRLRRQIVATTVVSDMVDRQGITYAYRLADETGAHLADTARAFVVAREVFDMAALWSAVRALDNVVPAAAQTRLLLEGRKLVERATRWLLRHRRAPIDVSATVARLAPGAEAVAALLPGVLSPDGHRVHRALAAELVGDGVPGELAGRVAGFEELFSALDIVDVANARNHPVDAVAATYFSLEDRLELRWLRDRVNELPRDNRWQTLARLALRDDLYGQIRDITAEALVCDGSDRWLDRKAAAVARVRQVLADIRAAGTFDLATLSVALRETQALVTPDLLTGRPRS
ncbi:MAG TPA: NAD-glutamate dehydrogenase [Jiangellaceae bacterium]|nr:NAD-glutamate dehydrogenase [Jiangellaceae bacterium]